jgi:hypothetical protein
LLSPEGGTLPRRHTSERKWGDCDNTWELINAESSKVIRKFVGLWDDFGERGHSELKEWEECVLLSELV